MPELRREGLLAARGEVVAVLEEHCTAPPGWLAAIEAHFRSGDAAIGGPILDDDFARLCDWVVYFSEYHNYMPPWERGERAMLNGANIAYARDKVLRHRDVLAAGYWEVVLHPPLQGDGAFRAVPEMGARHTGPFDYGYYLRQRYLLSRVWGGSQRLQGGRRQSHRPPPGRPDLPALPAGAHRKARAREGDAHGEIRAAPCRCSSPSCAPTRSASGSAT